MKSYFICLLIASVISALCGMLVSDSGFERYMKYVCSLICAIAVIAPFAAVMKKGIPDIGGGDAKTVTASADYIYEETAKKTEEYIATLIYDEFGITAEGVSIEIYSGDDGAVVGDITVILKDTDAALKSELESRLSKLTGCAVEVGYGSAAED